MPGTIFVSICYLLRRGAIYWSVCRLAQARIIGPLPQNPSAAAAADADILVITCLFVCLFVG